MILEVSVELLLPVLEFYERGSDGRDRHLLLGKMSFINEQTCRQAIAGDVAEEPTLRGRQGQGQEWLFGKLQGDRAAGVGSLGMAKAMMSAQTGLLSDRPAAVIALTVKKDIWKGCGLGFVF